eukprot:EG_transcript_8317
MWAPRSPPWGLPPVDRPSVGRRPSRWPAAAAATAVVALVLLATHPTAAMQWTSVPRPLPAVPARHLAPALPGAPRPTAAPLGVSSLADDEEVPLPALPQLPEEAEPAGPPAAAPGVALPVVAGTAAGLGALGGAAAVSRHSALSEVQHFVELTSNLFPLWTALVAALALQQPALFSFMSTSHFTAALACLMFSMGITLTVDDFVRVVKQPVPVALNFACCYIMMPALAFALAQWFQLSPAYTAGLVMVGAINGGQASNLCALIARGDVALSVLMTTSTTAGCMFMTPLVAWLALGAIVAVDSWGMACSTVQIVLLPILMGVVLNKYAPKMCDAFKPWSPLLGIASTVLLVGSSVASSAPALRAGGFALQWPVILFHVLGAGLGYAASRAAGLGEAVARTTALETAMKSSAFVYLLCCVHFTDYLVRVPCAVSVVWNAIIGSTIAVLWRFLPLPDDRPAEADLAL